MVDEIQYARCIALYRALLARAWDDLNALCWGQQVPGGESGLWVGEGERLALLEDTLGWFFSETPSPCSLNEVCEILHLDPGAERAKAYSIAMGERDGNTRRKRLCVEQIDAIRDALDAGQTTKELGARFKVDPSAIRKIRIRLRRRAAA